MGYTIVIGNAEPLFGERYPSWYVHTLEAGEMPSDAPTSGTRNTWSPSYGGWGNFCRETGLFGLFLGDDTEEALMHMHPGVARLRRSDLETIIGARKAWEARPWPTMERIPGFSDRDDPRYDGNMCILLWLEYWVGWALENCERPAIGNW